MKEEIYVISTVAKYGRLCITIGQGMAYSRVVSWNPERDIYFRSGPIIQYFNRDERRSMIGNLSSYYDTKCSILGGHKFSSFISNQITKITVMSDDR
jgi:hypothetical protein